MRRFYLNLSYFRADSFRIAKTVGHIRLACVLAVGQRPGRDFLIMFAKGGKVQQTSDVLHAIIDGKYRYGVILRRKSGTEIESLLPRRLQLHWTFARESCIELLSVISGRFVQVVVIR